METNRIRFHSVPIIVAIVFLQMAAASAGEQSALPGSTVQGSPFPGMPAVHAESRSQGPVEISFTKWARVVDGVTLLEGFTGGDVEGVFAGQVLRSQLSYDQRIVSLEAIYEVQAGAGPRSFTALIRGGRTNNPGDAILNGVILDGWRTGANVHVEFQRKPAPSPTESACEGAPEGLACFQGTITVGPAPH
jgi:hypothetical protein